MRLGLVVVVCGLVVLAGCGGGSSNTTSTPTIQAPVASAGGPYTGTAGTAVSFTGAGSSDPQGETLTYAWNFGDSGTGTGVSPTHTYAAAGTYTVSLTVTNTSNLTATATSKATIAAAPLPPVASAGGPYTGTAGTAVSFSGAGSTDPQGETLTYAWSFGDSGTGTGVSPTHTYAAAGTYTVSLTVTNTSNLTGTATSKATIAVAPLSDVALTGLVYGGSQPIVGAHVYLFAANTTGYGGAGLAASSSNASVSLLSAAETGTSDALGAYVATGSGGGFSLTGDYTCSSGQQLYLYALGGGNAAAGLMAAIGSCPASGSSAITVTVNEVSTIAAAYSFAGFATDATHVSSSGTALAQVGIANAFANAANLVSLLNGTALATTPAGNGTVPQMEINTLANILASCVNTASSCSTLMATATADGTATGTKPTDTATAAINIAHNPGANVATVYGLASSAVFTPKLTTQPNDFTVELNFTGGGVSEPWGLAIDGSGNAWVANVSGNSVSELSSSGVFLSGTSGYSGGGMTAPRYLAIDPSGDAWITGGSLNVVEISGTGSILSGAKGYFGYNFFNANSLSGGPSGIAIDGFGNVWVPNQSGNTGVSAFSNTGTFIGWIIGNYFYMSIPNGLAVDSKGVVWISSFPSGISQLTLVAGVLSGGTYFGVGGLANPSQVAIDGSGNVWISDTNRVIKLSNLSVPLSGANGYTGGLNDPTCIAIDGAGNAWVDSYMGQNLVEFSNFGTVLSGANGYRSGDHTYIYWVAIDGSGNVWTTTGNSVNELIGVATPVVTPIAAGLPATPTADGSSKLGTRP